MYNRFIYYMMKFVCRYLRLRQSEADPLTTERIELMPGVWLTAVRTDKFKSSYWALRLMAPLQQETASLNALLPYVLRRGTARFPDLASLSAELDELYGGIIEPVASKQGDVQVIGFAASFLDDACVPEPVPLMERAATLLGELLLHPATKNGRLRQEYVRSEQENLIRMIESRRNNKREYARQRLVEEMFSGENYALDRLGDAAELRKITALKLFRQYQTMLEKPPIELYYCGSVPAKRVELAWREALMGLPRSNERYLIETRACRGVPSEVRCVTERMEVTQGKMELGFRTGVSVSDPMFPALLVANAMFGGTTHSRLFLHVREKRSLCYYAVSSLAKQKGVLIVSCGVDPANFETAQTEILHQLDELQQGEFTPEEFAAAQKSVLNDLRSSLDEQSSLCTQWMLQRAAGEPFEPETLIERVSEVTEGMTAAAAMEIKLDTVYRLTGSKEEEAGIV